ncbi:lytic transglycosylase domain-containing protein [Streptomyces sp. NPDC002790]|uniref:lytic transglycosylase domain-containing protein n=1 Tax=Streptomyces sp. NPDC002790 TaxID=3154431 RepID=UPI003332FB58
MAAVFGRRLRRGVMTAAVAAAAVAALSASQAPGVSPPRADGGSSAADRSDDNPPDSATGPDYYTDLPPLDSPTDDPTTPGTGGKSGDDSGIPATVLDAYKKAAAELGTTKPGCNLDWQLLAAIGKVESGQARGGDVDANGTTKGQPILGPSLDGNGFAKVTDTDGGSYDGDTTHDHAVGPMQFIPSTWEWAGRDGNGDGKKDPNNIYDAALAAGHYLCRADRDLSNASDLNKAILSYNNSSDYLATVLKWLEFYRKNSHSVPDGTGVLPKHPSVGGTGSGAGASPSATDRNRNSGGSSDSPTTKPPSKNPPKTPSGGGSTSPGGGGTTSPPTTPPTPTPTPTPTESVTKLSDAGTGSLAALQDDSFSERVKVKAKNAAGSAVGSAKIRFAIVGATDATFTGGATSATVTTNSSGVATAPAFKAGKETGQFTVRATVVGRNVAGLDHTATVTARADKLERVGDDALTCEAGGTFDKAVELKATYKGAAADKVAATATLVTSKDDATEADKGPYFKDVDGKTLRTLKGLEADAEGHLTLPKLYADDTSGTFLLRVTTTGGATLTVELKVTEAAAS